MQHGLKNKFQQLQNQVSQSAEDAKDKVIDFSKHVAKDMDTEVRRKPWQFIGIAAIFSAIFGFFLGRKSK
jgi:ElaB/YqjD/DUF883 family membrane-anchored ribosome-binding protein